MAGQRADLIVRIITDAAGAAQGVQEATTAYGKFEGSMKALAGPAALVLGGVIGLGAISFGQAATASEEAAAAAVEMKTAMSDLGVAIGTALLPVMLPLIQAFTDLLNWVTQNMDVIGPLILIIGGIAAAILAVNAAMAIAKIVTGAWTAVTKIATIVQRGFNAAMKANPIGLIITLIGALITIFMILWNNCEGFRNFWIAMWEGMKQAVAVVVDWFSTAWAVVVEWFGDAWGNAIDRVTGFLQTLKDVALNVLDAILHPIERIVDAFKRVQDAVKGVIDWIKKIQIPDLSALNPFKSGKAAPAAFGLAVTPTAAGSVATPNRNRSAVPPASRGAASGGTVINITVNGALDPQSVSRQIARMLRVREGRVGLSAAAGVRA